MASFPETLVHASGRPIRIDTTRAMLAFDPPGRPAGFDKAIAAAGLMLEDALQDEGTKTRVNHTGRRCFVRSVTGKPIDPESTAKLLAVLGKKAGKAPRLVWIGPVYGFVHDPSDSGRMGVGLDVLRVAPARPGEAKSEKALSTLLARLGAKVDAKRSKHLSAALICTAEDLAERDAIAISAMLADRGKELVRGVHPDYVPLVSPAAAIPSSETFWAQQWNMVKIGAPAAWNTSVGDPSVYVCVVDSGIERGHEELNRPTSWGYEAATPSENSGVIAGPLPDVTKPSGTTANDAHGTAIASIAVGVWDSGGVAGLAGGASLFALAAPTWSAIELELAILRSFATPPGTTNRRVLLIGGTSNVVKTAGVTAAIDSAIAAGVFVVCPSGNADSATIPYPGDGTHPGIVVCGSTDTGDNRYLSNYGSAISVVAPGQSIPVADLTGAAGYGASSYHVGLDGSSCGAAHVAGLAALLAGPSGLDFTAYSPAAPNLARKIRSVIERTAEKAGGAAYSSDINPRNDQMGYGRIRADWAIDFADVMIADDPTDTGDEPSTGVFWRDSAVVIRRAMELQTAVDAGFDTWHANPPDSTVIYSNADGTPCYGYVRVKNLGPAVARNVRVRAVGAAASTGFMYPTDWTAAEDVNHMVMTPLPWPGDSVVGDEYVIATLTAGQSKIVRFEISKTQADKGLAWPGSHVCGLAKVTADNDYAFAMFNPVPAVSGQQARRNNLCQRNLHVVTAASPWFFPFLAGNPSDEDEVFEIVVEPRRLPAGAVTRLGLDEPERAAPKLDVAAISSAAAAGPADPQGRCGTSLTLLDRARVAVRCGGPLGIVTLPPGTRFECVEPASSSVDVSGGALVIERGKRIVEGRGGKVSARMNKAPGAVIPLYLEIPVPPGTPKSERYYVDIIQKNAAGEVVGGISLFLVP